MPERRGCPRSAPRGGELKAGLVPLSRTPGTLTDPRGRRPDFRLIAARSISGSRPVAWRSTPCSSAPEGMAAPMQAAGRTNDQIGCCQVPVAAAKAVDQAEHPGDAGGSAAGKHEGALRAGGPVRPRHLRLHLLSSASRSACYSSCVSDPVLGHRLASSYSSWRRHQDCGKSRPSSFRPAGARSRN
jgi:hypothetical protein